MSRQFSISGLIIICAMISACSEAQQNSGPTVPPTPVVFDAQTPTSADVTPTAAAEATIPAALPTWVTQLPPSTLGLSGRLIFTEGPLGVTEWDLSANRISALFVPPQNGVVNAASLSPDETTIVMAYGPPPPPGKPQLGYTSLYTVPTDGSEPPEPLIPGDHEHEFFFTPRWSADGAFVYFGHYIEASPSTSVMPGFFLVRRSYPGGESSTVTENAFVPYLSGDGTKLAYITVDPATYLNSMYVALPDGANATRLFAPSTLWAIDSLAISPDGKTIVFAGDSNGPTVAMNPGILALFGVRVAHAHSIPEDLWEISVTGGTVKRLTTLGITGLALDYSPDGTHIAFNGSNGVYVVNADGSGLTQLDSEPKFGTIQWAQ